MVMSHRSGRVTEWSLDRRDLGVIAGTYLGVVGLFFAAFRSFGTNTVLGLFLCFAAGLVLGVAAPVVYTVWRRRRPLSSLGFGVHQLPGTIAFGLLFAGIQFALTLWGYDLPALREDWVPLLVMALVVGIFESVFFRGFVQGRRVGSPGGWPIPGASPGVRRAHMIRRRRGRRSSPRRRGRGRRCRCGVCAERVPADRSCPPARLRRQGRFGPASSNGPKLYSSVGTVDSGGCQAWTTSTAACRRRVVGESACHQIGHQSTTDLSPTDATPQPPTCGSMAHRVPIANSGAC
jgi:hypothetical protein